MTLRLLTSGVLPVAHAFTTRHSGHSRGMFASLNFGNPSDISPDQRDQPATIRANFDQVCGALGCGGREIVEVHQVHSDQVHLVRSGHPSHPTASDTRADGLVSDDPSRLLVVRVADCAPILFSSGDGCIVGAAHAGWRGVIAGVVRNTVETMRRLGATDIAAAVGPCISVEHFEVGPEVAAEFERVFGHGTPVILARLGARPTVDLKMAIGIQLEECGVSKFDILPQCTFGQPELFFSHRRDQGKTGRMIGIIGAANNARS